MEKSTFVYVTYIRTTPEKLWAKLTETEVAREFFFATALHADWKVGGKWNSTAPDGTLVDGGEVMAIDPPKRLEMSFLARWSVVVTLCVAVAAAAVQPVWGHITHQAGSAGASSDEATTSSGFASTPAPDMPAHIGPGLAYTGATAIASPRNACV